MDVHYIQSEAWAKIKSTYGWKIEKVDCDLIEAGFIEVYTRSVVGVGRLIYIPCLNGLHIKDVAAFTTLLQKKYAKKGFGLRLELNQLEDQDLLAVLQKHGWKHAKSHVQYRHTILIDLTKPEDDIWMSFKSRGRYEVLQAEKAGVTAEDADPTQENLEKMYELMQITSSRNKFFIRDKEFTMSYWQAFAELKQLKLFFAYHEGELLAGSVILHNGKHAWNKDGGSTRTKANLMAPRMVQWNAMKTLKKMGITQYDLGGIPDPNHHEGSRIPGIYIFKSGFSKEHTTLMPTLELPLSVRYKLWPKAEKQWLRVYNLFAHNLWW